VGWLLAGKGVGAVLSLVYLGLTARMLGAVEFGQFTLILSTGQAIAAFIGFQTWQVVIRYGMAHLKEGHHDRLARLVAFCTALDLAAAAVGCVIATASVLLLGPRLGWSPGLSRAALAFCFVMLLSVRSTAVGVLRLYDRFGLGAVADSTTSIVRFIGCIVVVATHVSVLGFLVAWAAAEVVTTIVYWVFARRIAAPLGIPALRGGWRAAADNPGLWHFTWMTNLGSTLNSVSRQFSVIIVGLATGPVAAGNYRLAYQLSQSIVRVSEMFSRAVFAELTRAHVGEGRPDLQLLFRQLTRLALVAGVAVVLVLLLGRPVLILIAGSHHADAALPLRLLGLAAAFDLAGVGFEPALIAMGLAGRAFRLRVVATVCLILGFAVLLPLYGGTGAATATLVASAFGLALFGRAAWRAIRTS